MSHYFVVNIARWRIAAFLFLIHAIIYSPVQSQPTSFNFRRLTNAEGLSDGIVHAFVQDKYGFIWIGTKYGLNRFDGINIKTFFSKHGDSSSLGNDYIFSLYCDTKANLWIGTFHGLCRYNYSTSSFVNYTAPRKVIITGILEDKKGQIWLAADDGLWIVDEQKLSIKKFLLPNDSVFQKTFHSYVYQMIASPRGDWYFATNKGIKIFNPLTYAYSEIRQDPHKKFSISNDFVYSVSLDSTGYLWASCGYGKSFLNKIDLKDHSVKLYDRFIKAEKKWSSNTLQRILTDQKGRVWITASVSGLSLYNEKKDDFIDYKNDPFNPNSLLSNQNQVLYQDREGIIWVGTPAYGLSYFNPDKNFFSTISPFLQLDNPSTDTWGRAACEDNEGNLWLATGNGLAIYDSNWQLLKTFTNDDEKKPVLHLNSVRSLLQDETGDVWIGTAKGLNRYRPSTGTMDFFNEKQAIPLSFFWM
ncbi:MAG TPA: two-component regulator propeller domain-containing protein, partial [Chitinophagaceae bacterium]|nr:two-component regulator propeller domain-containing protein [Chitinophagaceae bacterium]